VTRDHATRLVNRMNDENGSGVTFLLVDKGLNMQIVGYAVAKSQNSSETIRVRPHIHLPISPRRVHGHSV